MMTKGGESFLQYVKLILHQQMRTVRSKESASRFRCLPGVVRLSDHT